MNVKRKPWSAFAREAHPVIAVYVETYRQAPYSPYLRQQGYGWLVSAADKHYGGYHRTLRRLGFTPPPRPLLHLPGCRPHGYWANDDNVRRELAAAFPDLLAWETMPSIHMIQDKLPGLATRILTRQTITEMCRRLGLPTFWVGQRARRRVEGIDFALTFYEQHYRWPHASECSSGVRNDRFIRGRSWHDYCRPVALPRTGLERVIKRFQLHRVWLQQHQPNKVLTRQRVLNHLIIELSRRFPPLP